MKRSGFHPIARRFSAPAAARSIAALLAFVLGVPAVAETRANTPSPSFRDCPECPEMVVIPAGTFVMGSPSEEKERFSSEGPPRRVTIAQPFALGKYEVTFAEWDACVAVGGCTHRPGDFGWGRGRRPVIQVSWSDAKAYVAWLSRTTGKSYRLPSEAEWEYAARAGTTTPFSTGVSISTDQANYNGHFVYGGGRKGKYLRQTLEVGTFAPNLFGLHDMHGNVREWVEDCWNDSYSGAPADGRPLLTGDCSRRVGRGGSFYHIPGFARSASRIWHDIGYRNVTVGFRVARTN